MVGKTTEKEHLILSDEHFDTNAADIPMSLLFGNPPKIQRSYTTTAINTRALTLGDIDLDDAAKRLLNLPTIADKSFLITIGALIITGMVARDQMVGP